jgi:hypothetical protein
VQYNLGLVQFYSSNRLVSQAKNGGNGQNDTGPKILDNPCLPRMPPWHCTRIDCIPFWIFMTESACAGSWYLSRYPFNCGITSFGDPVNHALLGCAVKNSSATCVDKLIPTALSANDIGVNEPCLATSVRRARGRRGRLSQRTHWEQDLLASHGGI